MRIRNQSKRTVLLTKDAQSQAANAHPYQASGSINRRQLNKVLGGGASAMAVKGSTALVTIAATTYAPESKAIVGPILRLLLHAVVRGGGRAAMRGLSRGGARAFSRGWGSAASRGSRYGYTSRRSIVNRIYDGYTAIDLVSSFTSAPPGVIAVPDHIAAQAQKHDAEMIWFKDQVHGLRFDFINDSGYTIPAPEVFFEQHNLDMDELFVREGTLRCWEDWPVDGHGSVPAANQPDSEALPIVINDSGPIAIRPHIPAEPDVYMAETVVMVVDRSDVQWRRG